VPNGDSDAYPFMFEAVREEAPSASGLSSLYTAGQWIYVGQCDDIRRSLFRHLNEPSAGYIKRFGRNAQNPARCERMRNCSTSRAMVISYLAVEPRAQTRNSIGSGVDRVSGQYAFVSQIQGDSRSWL
jgi:hypothetical protein